MGKCVGMGILVMVYFGSVCTQHFSERSWVHDGRTFLLWFYRLSLKEHYVESLTVATVLMCKAFWKLSIQGRTFAFIKNVVEFDLIVISEPEETEDIGSSCTE